jgi:hypothetical protein
MKPTYIQTFFECYYYYDNTPWSSTNTYKHTFPKNILKTGQDSTSGLDYSFIYIIIGPHLFIF